MKKYLIGVLLLFVVLGVGALAAAQQPPSKDEGFKAQGQAGDTKFDIQVQGQKGEEGRRGTEGPQGPAGAPGPQGAPGPSSSSGGAILGMDPTVALLVGLGILAVVIVAIVAASRSGREIH